MALGLFSRARSGSVIIDRGLTPQQFYRKYVADDLSDCVYLVSGASSGAQLKKYIMPDKGDVIEGCPITFVTVPTDTLRALAVRQLTSGEGVLFASDVLEQLDRPHGILDDRLYDYESLFDIRLDMTRAERFASGQAAMTHAMVLKGVDLDGSGKPLSWRVENSWGPDVGDRGMFRMSDGWFERYVYQVVIRRRHVPEEILRIYDAGAAEARKNWQPCP